MRLLGIYRLFNSSGQNKCDNQNIPYSIRKSFFWKRFEPFYIITFTVVKNFQGKFWKSFKYSIAACKEFNHKTYSKINTLPL